MSRRLESLRTAAPLIGLLVALALPAPASATHGYDMDCGNFASQASAQYHMNAHPGDPDRLDGNDDDGRACESNKCPCYYGYGTSPEQPYALPPAPTPTPTPAPAPSAQPAPVTPPTAARTYRATIVGVVDGDTLKLRLRSGSRKTVRLIGIDAPESGKPGVAVECGAKRATARMRKLANRKRKGRRAGHPVRLRTDPTQDTTDRYGRLLAYVNRTSDGKDLGRSMVAAGWATTYVYDGTPFLRVDAYARAEGGAASRRLGVHGQCGGDFHSEQG